MLHAVIERRDRKIHMILTCPACSARFKVPDDAIGIGGRTVRCSKCSHMWRTMPTVLDEAFFEKFQPAVEPVLEAPPPPVVETPTPQPLKPIPTAAPKLKTPPKPKPTGPKPVKINPYAAGFSNRRRVGVKTLFASGILTLGVLYIAALLFTPSLLGIQSSEQLALADVVLKRTSTDSTNQRFTSSVERYTLEGKVLNQGDETVKAPLVRMVLYSRDGTELNRWWVKYARSTLDKGEAVPFVLTDLDIPKEEGIHIHVDLGNWLELALRNHQ